MSSQPWQSRALLTQFVLGILHPAASNAASPPGAEILGDVLHAAIPSAGVHACCCLRLRACVSLSRSDQTTFWPEYILPRTPPDTRKLLSPCVKHRVRHLECICSNRPQEQARKVVDDVSVANQETASLAVADVMYTEKHCNSTSASTAFRLLRASANELWELACRILRLTRSASCEAG